MDHEMFPNGFLVTMVVYFAVFVVSLSTFVFPAINIGLWNYMFFWVLLLALLLPMILIIV